MTVNSTTEQPASKAIMNDEWLMKQWDATMMLASENTPVADVLRIFANRVLQTHGDREGMRLAFSEMRKREEAGVPAPTMPPTEIVHIPAFNGVFADSPEGSNAQSFNGWAFRRTSDNTIEVSSPSHPTKTIQPDVGGLDEMFFQLGESIIAGAIPSALVETYKLRWQDIDSVPHETLVLLAGTMGHSDDWRIKVGSLNDGEFTIYGGSWKPKKWMHLPPPPGAARSASLSEEFRCEDPHLDLLLNLTADLLKGNAGTDLGLWWAETLETLELRLKGSASKSDT